MCQVASDTILRALLRKQLIMKQKKGGRGLLIILVGLIILGAGGYFLYTSLITKTDFAPLSSFKKTTVEAPVLETDLAQTTLITPEDGGVIRAIDSSGLVSILRVPKGAVNSDTEITLTPIKRGDGTLESGVAVEPSELTFKKPVTLSFNWYLSEDKKYENRPYVLNLDTERDAVVLSPLQRALVVKNFLPTLITNGGVYGISDDAELEIEAAQNALAESNTPLVHLNAGLVLREHNKLSSKDAATIEKITVALKEQEEPDINELYVAVMLEENAKKTTSLVPRAHAYGLLDGYLQFRCNYEDTTYEDAIIAMTAAAHLRYTDVEETCKTRAIELLIERANLVDADKNRPLIDAVEVLQQMQMLGLTDENSPGAAVAERLHNDVQASLHRLNPDLSDAPESGTARDNTASTDPLLKHNSTIIQEMIGIQLSRFIGLESFDEAGLKNFAEKMHTNVSNLNTVVGAMCDIDEAMPYFREVGAQIGLIEEFDKRCGKIQSGEVQNVLDRWKLDTNEMAEGVDAVQKGQTPNSNAEDFSVLESMLDRLEQ